MSSTSTQVAQLSSIPQRRIIREKIDSESLLLVVGSGVSSNATGGAKESSWNGLLEIGLDEIHISDKQKKEHFGRMLEINDATSSTLLAGIIEHEMGGSSDYAFYQWLQDTVGRLRPVKRDILDAIRDLHVPIATTNYDHLLEDVTNRRPITLDDYEELLKFVRGDNINDTILHLHGYYRNPRSVIFSARSYYELILTKKYAESVLRALAIRYTWLFIGCGNGLDDPHFRDIANWMEDSLGTHVPWHYSLVKSAEGEPRHVRGRIEKVCYGHTYDQLVPFLRGIKPEGAPKLNPEGAQLLTSRLDLCETRAHDLRIFRKALLAHNPKPIAVLGGFGLGKTTFCLRGVTYPDVRDYYQTRKTKTTNEDGETNGRDKWYQHISLDACISIEAMLHLIALSIGVDPTPALAGPRLWHCSEALLDRIVEALRTQRTILVLDGVEKLWAMNESRTESILAKISEGVAASNSALVVVVSGYRRPLKLQWGVRIDLTPLSDEDSVKFFVEIANNVARGKRPNASVLCDSEDVRSLITMLDGIPLAIKVIASMAAIRVCKEGGTRDDWISVLGNLREEWKRACQDRLEWRRPPDEFGTPCSCGPESIDVRRGEHNDLAVHPLFNLWISLEIALADLSEPSRRLFQLLGLFPAGLTHANINRCSKNIAAVQSIVHDLERRALVSDQDQRVRLAPSAYEFVRKGLTQPIGIGNDKAIVASIDKKQNLCLHSDFIDLEQEDALVNYYNDLAKRGQEIGWGHFDDEIGEQPSPGGPVLTADERKKLQQRSKDIRETIDQLHAEASNIEAIIRARLEGRPPLLEAADSRHKKLKTAIRMALALGRFYRFSGIVGTPKILRDAREACTTLIGNDWTALRAECNDWTALRAECALVSASMERLGVNFEKASALYKSAKDDYNKLETDSLRSLGLADCERALGDFEKFKGAAALRKAKEHYEAAFAHYESITRSQDPQPSPGRAQGETQSDEHWLARRGQAWCLANLGDISHVSRQNEESNDKPGTMLCCFCAEETGCLGNQGDEIARGRTARCLYFYSNGEFEKREGRDHIGRAHCIKGLGDIAYIRQPDTPIFRPRNGQTDPRNLPFSKPALLYKAAKTLYKTNAYTIGVADCEYSLGDENIRRAFPVTYKQRSKAGSRHLSDLDVKRLIRVSEGHYKRAHELYVKIGSLHGVASCLCSVGDLLLLESETARKDQQKTKRDKKEESRWHYKEALRRYSEVEASNNGQRGVPLVGPANCWQGLGDILSAERDDSGENNEYYDIAENIRKKAFENGKVEQSFIFGFGWKRWRR